MTDKTAAEAMARGLRESDPEGCDEEWSYEPQATRLIEWLKANGFAVVPVDPTPEMVQAAHIGYRKSTLALGHNLPDIYRAMIAAAQGGE